jgi:endonuclease V-like protein UPF0215 family
MYNLRHVKKEIRVLGLAVKPSGADHRFYVVGVVYRGRHWLDGVMRTTVHDPEITEDVVEMIRKSPHHPQIRAILLDGNLVCDEATIDPISLSSGASKPVIALNIQTDCSAEHKHVQKLALTQDGASIHAFSVGLRSRLAQGVLEVASRSGEMPEALRVARLVISALSDGDPT